MNAHTTNSKFKFELPSLSYVDASWEEPTLRAPANRDHPARRTGLSGWIANCVTAFKVWQRNRQAVRELNLMSDHELKDIGLVRADLGRAFDPALNADLQERGDYR